MSEATVGKASYDLSIKNETVDHSVEEQMREQLSEYDTNVTECVTDGIKVYDGIFYVVVITKKERLMENVLRHYFFHRSSCPTPDYDQSVYRYEHGSLKFLWVLPAKDVCNHLRDNALLVKKEEKELLNYVLDFYEGTLDKKARLLNGELKGALE